MNKVLLHQKSSNSSARLWKGILMGLMVWWTCPLQAQTPDCNVIMACNDLIQVSLGSDCTETLQPNMLVEDPTYPNNMYTVTLWRQNGVVVPDNVLRNNMIGEVLSARVQLNGCAISCWGNLTVEDKLPPVITGCTSPIIVECSDNINPGGIVPRPVASDACTSTTFTYEDKTEKLLCSAPYTMTVTRKWLATDRYGNTATCSQIINVKRANISDVTFPQNYEAANALECGAAIPYLPNGAPSPDFTGYPTGVDCPNIQYFYNDIVFDLCGNGKKVLRQWTVLDWCSGRDTIGNQIIKLIDTRAPVCISPPDFVFNATTDEGKCTATFDVPPPTIAFECSSYDYTVGYKLRDENGQPFVNQVFDNVTRVVRPDSSYFYRISGLPQDTTWIIYNIVDACGNASMCFTEVFVQDKEKPSAICEGYSVVTLAENGWADVFAESIDDHSKDNCEIVNYQVRRLTDACDIPGNLTFAPKVNFCCADVSPDPDFYVKVVLRVTDKSGNYNDCVANVKVQDKKNPTIQCPANRTIQCESSSDPSITGVAVGFDNCEVDIDHRDANSLNRCGIGSIRRTWTATDPGGRTATCVQTITVGDSDPFSRDDIVFPADITINGCSKADADPELINSLPTFTNNDCADIAMSYEDIQFSVADACVKISRVWRLIDWCTYTPQNAQYIEHIQKITLTNTEAPRFTSDCGPKTFTSPENDCEEYIEHSASAIDDCTPESQIRYRWELDANNNGTVDSRGNGKFTAGVYPFGTHRFTFYATDLCDNTSSCSYIFTVRDGKAPTPICHREIVWVLDEDGNAEVWANDFDLKSVDNCNSTLRFSFNEQGTQPAMNFTCDDIPNGVAAVIPLRMYVFDSDNNHEYCAVNLILQDSPNKNACRDNRSSIGLLGKVMHESEAGMSDIELTLKHVHTNEARAAMTNSEGAYEFGVDEFYGEYNLAPQSNDELLNGVSTLDLVLMQRHILGISKLDEPTKIIAADINADNKITTSDLVNLRKAILGITNSYQNNNSWRFVPSSFEFETPTLPWGFPEAIYIDTLMLDQADLDFVAIKVGDVNHSSKANLREGNTDNRSAGINIMMDNTKLIAGEVMEVPIYAGDVEELFGMQLHLVLSAHELEVLEVVPGLLNVSEDMTYIGSNFVKLAWSNNQPVHVDKGIVLFSLKVKALTNTDLTSLNLAKEGMESESYGLDLTEEQISLSMRGLLDMEAQDVLITPNPFTEKTQITFGLKNAQPATFVLYDINGQKVYQQIINGQQGSNNIDVLSQYMDNQPGVYLFRIEAGSQQFSGKVILVK